MKANTMNRNNLTSVLSGVLCPCGTVEWDQEEIESLQCKCCGLQQYDHIKAFPPHPDNASIKRRAKEATDKILQNRRIL